MFYLQIATAVISLLIGLTQITKESFPLVRQVQQNLQEQAERKATLISQMNIPWEYQGNDGSWQYYSDPSKRYWCRVNAQGIQEYCEYPQLVAGVPSTVR